MKFHLTIDFPDDVLWSQGVWTEEALRWVIRDLHQKGISAIHWIDHPVQEEVWVAGGCYDCEDGRGSRMIANIPNPLATICDEAKQHDMQVYSVLKPIDLVLGTAWSNLPLGKEQSPMLGLPQVGGSTHSAPKWLRENPDKRMSLHPSLERDADHYGHIDTIRLWHKDDQLDEDPEIKIWISRDNGQYVPYAREVNWQKSTRKRQTPLYHTAPGKAFDDERECVVYEAKGLDIDAAFVNLEFIGQSSLENTLYALVEVQDPEGRDIPFTHGVVPTLSEFHHQDQGWQKNGIAFDDARNFRFLEGEEFNYSRLKNPVCMSGLPFLAIARGRNSYLTAISDMALPEVHDWMIDLSSHAISAGVDGIDLRISTHTQSTDFKNYGFDKALIAAYQMEHGIDVATQNFDRDDWMRFRGRCIDKGIAKLSTYLRQAGKSFILHALSEACEVNFNSYWNWKDWIRAGHFDMITAKGGGFLQQLRQDPDSRHLPLIHMRKPGGKANWDEQVWLDILDEAQELKAETFNIYELGCLGELRKDGSYHYHFKKFWDRVASLAKH